MAYQDRTAMDMNELEAGEDDFLHKQQILKCIR